MPPLPAWLRPAPSRFRKRGVILGLGRLTGTDAKSAGRSSRPSRASRQPTQRYSQSRGQRWSRTMYHSQAPGAHMSSTSSGATTVVGAPQSAQGALSAPRSRSHLLISRSHSRMGGRSPNYPRDRNLTSKLIHFCAPAAVREGRVLKTKASPHTPRIVARTTSTYDEHCRHCPSSA